MDEVNKQMNQRKELNEKLGALVAKRDKYVAEHAPRRRRRHRRSTASSRIR